MRYKKLNSTGIIAKERLKQMIESQSVDNARTMTLARRDISEIVEKYFDVSSGDYEIKLIFKQDKKRD